MCLQCHFLPEAGYSVGHYFEDPLRNPSYLHRFQLAPQANEAWCTKVQQGIKSEFKKWNIFSPIIEKSYNHTQETFFRLHTNVQLKHRAYRDFAALFIMKKILDSPCIPCTFKKLLQIFRELISLAKIKYQTLNKRDNCFL